MEFDKTLIEKEGRPEIEDLKAYFKKNDYTTAPLPFDPETGAQKDVNVYMKAREHFKASWLRNQKKMGGKASFANFSSNYPIAILESADEQLISGTVTNIMADEELYSQTLDVFFDNLRPQIELAYETYAKAQKKEIDELTDKEIQYVIDKFVDLYLDQMMNLLMQSQSVPDLLKTTKKMGTHEDFNNFISRNGSRADFYRKWDHTRTKIGKIFSFSDFAETDEERIKMEETSERSRLGYLDDEIAETEKLFMEFESLYKSSLDSVETKIYDLRKKGLTTTVIAKDIGYASHSTVVKKLKKMRKKFDELCERIEKTR